MKILLAGGGTAGHINPALAIADYAVKKDKSTKVLFIGTERGMERKRVPEAGYDIKFVKVEGLSKKISYKNFKALIHMLTAKKKCKKIIREFAPDIVIGTGGYVCAPAVMAANSLNIPTLIHEQNVFPGSAIKLLGKTSSVTAISFEDSRKYLADAKELLYTGNPIRESILDCNRADARRTLGLGDEKFIVFFGGSLGAEAINRVATQYIKNLKDSNSIKVLFATGERNYDTVMSEFADYKIPDNITVSPYIHNMDIVMNAADLLVCRSGAITVSEVASLGKAAIFVPSPNVTHNHQEYNARALSDSGAAVTILEKDFCLASLESAMADALFDEAEHRAICERALSLGSTKALEIIYNKITELVKG